MGKKRWPIFNQPVTVQTEPLDVSSFGSITKQWASVNQMRSSSSTTLNSGWSATGGYLNVPMSYGTTTTNAASPMSWGTSYFWAAPPWVTFVIGGSDISVAAGIQVNARTQDPSLEPNQLIYGDATHTIVEWL